MHLPAPPLNEHSRLAVNTADITGALVQGLVGSCATCGHSVPWWWCMPDGTYVAVHPGCARKLIEHWHQRIETGDVEEAPVVASARRGAYARRASPTGARVHPPRPRSAPSRSLGSPWFRPGMPEGAPWVIVVESTHGRLTFTHGPGEEHARGVLSHYEALTRRDLPLWFGGPVGLGAALIDPTGAIVDGWGEEFDLDAPSPHRPPTRPVLVAPVKPKRKTGPKAKTFD
jgi:hypothetical protein